MNAPRFTSAIHITDEALDTLEGQYGPYVADRRLVHAANTALGLQMPLLLTGDPGSGKSDFAWVLAKHLHGEEAEPLRCQVRSTTTARELLYHYDALVRFADAQSGGDRARAHEPRHYIRLRPLGIALMSSATVPPVVLVDEIDKAPRDLPNDLLWELDEGHFEIREIADRVEDSKVRDPDHPEIPLCREMRRPKKGRRPLVVITSNAERQLPEAFLRRCVFFHIRPADEERLRLIIDRRFPDTESRLRANLMRVFEALRKERLTKKPTTAEMLDWAQALTTLHHPSEIGATLERYANAVDGGRLKPDPQKQTLWIDLPALGCLVKLREDYEQLERRGA